ncbi:MAG TPA: FHA domain-containing protein, partial [Longimicrobiaceae bacterium]|nr:FHA domain-containing protein [Longimicrobiaceae bacterium]
MSAEPGGTADPGIHFRILSGARAPAIVHAAGPIVSIGRHPESDLRFDPDHDRSVSTRHAEVSHDRGRWLIRDLGSTNGTLVNGRPISASTPLRDGDRIAFGTGGPEVEFRLGTAPHASPFPQNEVDSPTGVHVGVLVRQRTRLMTIAVGVMGIILVTVVVVVLTASERRSAEWGRERDAMRLQIDSLHWAQGQTVIEIESQLAGLNAALERAEDQVRALESSLGQAVGRGAVAEADDLRRQLDDASADLQEKQTTAALDFRAIRSRNRPGVAMIYVEMPNGEVSTGSAFAVRPDATLVTSKHLVAGSQGRSRPRRIAIQFSDSEQVWP